MSSEMAPIQTTAAERRRPESNRRAVTPPPPDQPARMVEHEPSPATGRQSAERVARRLRRQIASHAIAPGARLREWDVARDCDVPRLTAREALDALVHQGFLERQPNRGVVVRRRELPELLQLFDLREVNEGLCARLAARNAEPESWDDLIALFGAPMAAVVERKDLDAYVRNYEKLRRRLMQAADSSPLTDILQRLQDMTGVFSHRVLLVSDRTQQALHDHRAVLAALSRGNAAAAERARRTTISNVRAMVQRYHAFVL